MPTRWCWSRTRVECCSTYLLNQSDLWFYASHLNHRPSQSSLSNLWVTHCHSVDSRVGVFRRELSAPSETRTKDNPSWIQVRLLDGGQFRTLKARRRHCFFVVTIIAVKGSQWARGRRLFSDAALSRPSPLAENCLRVNLPFFFPPPPPPPFFFCYTVILAPYLPHAIYKIVGRLCNPLFPFFHIRPLHSPLPSCYYLWLLWGYRDVSAPQLRPFPLL